MLTQKLSQCLARMTESEQERQAREDQEYIDQAKTPTERELRRTERHLVRKAQREQLTAAPGAYAGLSQ